MSRLLSKGNRAHRPMLESLESRLFLSVTQTPHFGSASFNITTFGASTKASNNASAIQNAINAASAAKGGGTVIVPAGTFLSGPLALKSNVNIQINGELQMLAKGSWPSASVSFLTGQHLTNIEISGNGRIDGQGKAWWSSTSTRPREVVISNSSVIELTGVTFTNAPMEHIQIQNTSSQITINGIKVSTDVGEANKSHNTDGIDLSGQHAIVENCQITTGDDNLAIGANSSTAGGTSDITVTHNIFGGTGGVSSHSLQGHGLSIGSHTENGVSGVFESGDTFNGTDNGIRIKSVASEGGIVSNIHYSNDTLNNIRQYAILLDPVYPAIPEPPSTSSGATRPEFTNIHFMNIKENNCASAGYILGLPNQPATNITLQISGTASSPFELAFAGTSSSPIDFTGSTFTVNGKTAGRVKLFTGAHAKGF
ncbi:MAG: glycoside hydrolase family 28 protein [Planctomycetota bacterium]|nr:glycoside hydrolase family 28 protein [Planctomycetota bacterium]